jgi:hypothetical protein
LTTTEGAEVEVAVRGHGGEIRGVEGAIRPSLVTVARKLLRCAVRDLEGAAGESGERLIHSVVSQGARSVDQRVFAVHVAPRGIYHARYI